jgi:hypothetical protein
VSHAQSEGVTRSWTTLASDGKNTSNHVGFGASVEEITKLSMHNVAHLFHAKKWYTNCLCLLELLSLAHKNF